MRCFHKHLDQYDYFLDMEDMDDVSRNSEELVTPVLFFVLGFIIGMSF